MFKNSLLSNHNNLFKKMAIDSPEVLTNIELLLGNKLLLDKSYHEPQKFFLHCNNILSNYIYFIEYATKAHSKYQWLYESIKNDYLINENENNAILKAIRNKALHSQAIIPDGSLSFNLYQIISQIEYKPKICIGNDQSIISKLNSTIYMTSYELFQKFAPLFSVFLDIDHSTYGECFGITRRWYYKAEYKYNKEVRKKIIDIYELINNSCDSLINTICIHYSNFSGIEFNKINISINPKYNYVNTLLEIDIYPNLFDKWWNGNFKPLNFKSLIDFNTRNQINTQLNLYHKIFNDLPKNIHQYIERLKFYENVH